MVKRAWMLVLALVALVTAAVHSQTPLPNPTAREPSWAFQAIEGQLPAEPPEPVSIPGSTQKYAPKQIDDLYNPPDWFPDQHPKAPEIVLKGRAAAQVMACGACHLMSPVLRSYAVKCDHGGPNAPMPFVGLRMKSYGTE